MSLLYLEMPIHFIFQSRSFLTNSVIERMGSFLIRSLALLPFAFAVPRTAYTAAVDACSPLELILGMFIDNTETFKADNDVARGTTEPEAPLYVCSLHYYGK